MIVGTAGHIDHGKTSLVRALTGVETDRLKEEKARGISIDLGFAYLGAPDGTTLGFVDVPGHEKFIHTMLAGATGIDFVLLVVGADDGVMPQTREHLAIVELLGIERGLVALTKIDAATPEQREKARNSIEALLSSSPLADAEVLPVSAVTGEGIELLRQRLFSASAKAKVRARSSEGMFRFAVDRSFTLAGVGTVVTGIVRSGQVTVGDAVAISPAGRAARVRSIHAQNRAATRGEAGERCALNLAGDGVTRESIARGDFVVTPALHAPADRIDAMLHLLPSETKSARQWTPVRLHHGAAEIGARIVLLGDDPIDPGAQALAQLVLERPTAAVVGDRFVLRDTTAQRTIGGGVFLDVRSPSRKRRAPERLVLLRALAIAVREDHLAEIVNSPPYYADLSGFGRDRALSRRQVDDIAGRLGAVRIAVGAADYSLSPGAWSQFVERLFATLKAFHADNPDLPGIGFERLRLALEPRLPAALFRSALRSFAARSEIALDGAWVRLASHEAKLTSADEVLWRRVSPLLSGEARFHPPRVRDIAGLTSVPEVDIRRVMKLLARMGKVDEIAHDHFFSRQTVAEMASVARKLALTASNGQFAAAQFRDRLDNGRKVAIQVLEFFDRHGLTIRRGDLRRINRHRLDLFGTASGASDSLSTS
ncbi:MAG TPA: selenocysteine-specific translation elongation factor [Roseiarcus sp.]|nr:selenocysteine-specific translation elongation factor [Roseiarcus sp.]